ncbi:gliding motility-associated ABC transporter substrate-binding protein GldG [Aureitalea marina]|uniref:Gliding motility-associated ABC transporter substrate-binding protein GldG n=1 Tax=Aureitalea marina TaxID=930804 RepID=A0A2S7KNS1_9FLAO|nr:gliding motility-associated ABC transporter substrate-binding protein GldG [Aureitalea marina]PQB04257.1 gliding motility-associated ABC transporter substrate-binding protein GldG [Aureitalea marina]
MSRLLKHIRKDSLLLIGLLILLFLGQRVHLRVDLTQDSRYTLSEVSEELCEQIQEDLIIEVFMGGALPAEFMKLRAETDQLLAEYQSENESLFYRMVDPLADEAEPEVIQQQLAQSGLTPVQVDVQRSGRLTSELVYPWALAYYQGRTVKIQLLKNNLGSTTGDRINSSIQNLEYAISEALSKLVQPKSKKVAVLKGNGQTSDRYIADFFGSLREYYYIAPFTLDSVAIDAVGTLEDLNDFDLVVSAGPTEAFTDQERYVLDQYQLQGGRSLWLVDGAFHQTDSLSGNNFAFPQDLNLNDFFFRYGVRINPNLVKDVYSAPILLASGADNQAEFNRFPWFYYPLSVSAGDHPVSVNLEGVKFEYTSSMDTLPNPLEKTILLTSSPLSKLVGLPAPIDFDKEIPENLKIVNEGPGPQFGFDGGEIPLAVLIEGEFSSVYRNRIKPFTYTDGKDEGEYSRMIVIADASLINNQLDGNGRPVELGFDRYTGNMYGNKEFLLNAVNYLLDDSGLINIRSKEVSIAVMDPDKIADQRLKWQLVNILVPLLLMTVLGILFQWSRKRRYSR